MGKYFPKHMDDNEDEKSKEFIGKLLWGGNEAASWSSVLVKKMKELDETQMSHFSNKDITKIHTESVVCKEENLKKKFEKEKDEEVEKMSDEKEEVKPEEKEEFEKEKSKEEPVEKPEEKFEVEIEIEEKEESEEEDKEGEEEVSMSLDAYADVSALMELLGKETEQYKSMSEEFAKPEKDFAKISKDLYFLCCEYSKKCALVQEENEGLKKFKADVEEKEFRNKVYSTLEEVKEFVTEAELTAMQEKSANFSIETIGAWEKEVKASLFSTLSKKVNKDDADSFNKMQFPFSNKENVNDKKYIW